jgi:hypothetical protein
VGCKSQKKKKKKKKKKKNSNNKKYAMFMVSHSAELNRNVRACDYERIS